CRVEGDREKRGWYVLHELPVSGGELLIVGSFGVWRGSDNGAQKVELRKRDSDLTVEQRETVRRRIAEDRKRADRERAEQARRAADRARQVWTRLSETGDAEYLQAKAVGGFGVRFTKKGAAVVPLLDTHGELHGLQILRSSRQAKEQGKPGKEYWPPGVVKQGHFHLIGSP